MGLKCPPVTFPPIVIATYKPMGITHKTAGKVTDMPAGFYAAPDTTNTIVETRIAVPNIS